MSIIANLSSGFIGAILGAVAVVFVSYRERLHASRSRLRNLLLRNGHSIWWGKSGQEPWQIIDSNYTEIQAEYLSLRSVTFCNNRHRLDKAWIGYTGVGHYQDIPEGDPSKIFAKSTVDRNEAIQRIIDFLQAIE